MSDDVNKNMTTCKSCGAQIAKNAKNCPSCGAKNKKPIYKRVWFIVLAAIIVISIIGAAFGDDDTSTSNPKSNSNSSNSSSSSNKTTSANTETEETPTASLEELEATVEDLSYEDLARNPDSHKGSLVKFTGKVIQVVEPYSWSNTTVYRINVSKGDWGYDYEDIIYVEYVLPKDAPRVLEDDEVTVYGNFVGLESYESLAGKQTIPKLQAERIEILGKAD